MRIVVILGVLASVCYSQMVIPSFPDRGDDHHKKPVGGFKCRLPVDVGPCRASMRRYYYDYKIDNCKSFLYGGCQGNDNNFETVEQCREECQTKHTKEPAVNPFDCHKPKDPGPCKGREIKYYFDGKKCKPFVYGGCQGNKNNFPSESKCNSVCRKGIPRSPSFQRPLTWDGYEGILPMPEPIW